MFSVVTGVALHDTEQHQWLKKRDLVHSNMAWWTWLQAAAIDLCSPHSICCLLAFVSSYKSQQRLTGHLPPAAPILSPITLLLLAAFSCRGNRENQIRYWNFWQTSVPLFVSNNISAVRSCQIFSAAFPTMLSFPCGEQQQGRSSLFSV